MIDVRNISKTYWFPHTVEALVDVPPRCLALSVGCREGVVDVAEPDRRRSREVPWDLEGRSDRLQLLGHLVLTSLARPGGGRPGVLPHSLAGTPTANHTLLTSYLALFLFLADSKPRSNRSLSWG